jgi:hypothetical protein
VRLDPIVGMRVAGTCDSSIFIHLLPGYFTALFSASGSIAVVKSSQFHHSSKMLFHAFLFDLKRLTSRQRNLQTPHNYPAIEVASTTELDNNIDLNSIWDVLQQALESAHSSWPPETIFRDGFQPGLR